MLLAPQAATAERLSSTTLSFIAVEGNSTFLHLNSKDHSVLRSGYVV